MLSSNKFLTATELIGLAKEEESFVKKYDIQDADTWYLVDTKWLEKWRAFVREHQCLPGPVDNSRLVDSRTGVPKPGLAVRRDYRGIAKEIWMRWMKMYGGGPEVVRTALDIYSPAPRLPPPLPPHLPRQRFNTRARDTDDASLGKVHPFGAFGVSQQNAMFGSVHSSSDAASRARRGKSVPPRQDSTAPASLPSRVEQRPQQKLCCDKCDGPHATDNCPHYKKPREQHRDAWEMHNNKEIASDSNLGAALVSSSAARVVRQPGDGSCLFHSLSYGLGDGSDAGRLREEICSYIQANPRKEIAGTPLNQWIVWDSGGSTGSYVARMRRRGEWGGGIEMAVVSQMRRVNVHVYEQFRGSFRRISAFTFPSAKKTVNVLYQGAMHYDALVL